MQYFTNNGPETTQTGCKQCINMLLQIIRTVSNWYGFIPDGIPIDIDEWYLKKEDFLLRREGGGLILII